MAVEIEINRDIVFVTLTGALSDADLQKIGTSIESLENSVALAPPRLADLTGIEKMEVGFQEMWALADKRRNSSLSNYIKTAMVVKTPVQRGMARMFQTLNDHPLITLEIFEDREEALAWLNS